MFELWMHCSREVLILMQEPEVYVDVRTCIHVIVVHPLWCRYSLPSLCARSFVAGTPLHHAAKERKKKAIRFLIRNGAFLPDEIHDIRFNPPLHYCPGLEWAYEEMKLLQLESSSSNSSGNWGCNNTSRSMCSMRKKRFTSIDMI